MQHLTTSEILFGVAFGLPLFSFVLSFIIPERYAWLTGITASALMLGSVLISISLFLTAEDILIQTSWFKIGSFAVNLTFMLDAPARLMLVVVTTVSFLVHVYSIGYMAGDAGIRKYFAMLGLFTFSMLGIVAAGHLILLFMFWELVGFASYLLIGHWMERPAAAKAAQKAFLFNRIGDTVFLIGIILLWIHEQTPHDAQWQTIGVLCVFGGVIGKSAQLPLFSWLPDAMEGPTPVSALLHAATMVAAGIFLLIRISPLLTEPALMVITVTGGVTAVVGAICALNQFDIKRILAYSTISQLGLMVTAVGIGANDAALLQLFTHAFFKAGLFLAAGSVIHAVTHARLQEKEKLDVQDIRNLGGLRKKLPVTCLTFCVAGASLSGLPLFSGFISKDSILSAAWALNEPFKWIIVTGISIVSFCTVLYTFRMIWFIFFGPESASPVRESPRVMHIPMIILSIASTWIIVALSPYGEASWFTRIFPDIQFLGAATVLSHAIAIAALVTAVWLYSKSSPRTIRVIEQGFNLDVLYQRTFGVLTIALSDATARFDTKWIDGLIHLTAYTQVALAHGMAWLDQHLVDGLVNTGARLTGLLGTFARSFQAGKVQLYIFWAVAGLIIFLFFALI